MSPTLKDLSLEQCAHHCSELSGEDCNSFEFCDRISEQKQVRTCRMSKNRNTNSGESKVDDQFCGVYRKEAAPSETSKSYSSSLSGWMAVLFLLVGSAIGIGAWKAKTIYMP